MLLNQSNCGAEGRESACNGACMKRMEETIPLDKPESPRTVFEDIREASQRPDPLRRLTPTPYTAGLPIMGRTVKLKTNDLRILERAVEVSAPYPGSLDGDVDF